MSGGPHGVGPAVMLAGGAIALFCFCMWLRISSDFMTDEDLRVVSARAARLNRRASPILIRVGCAALAVTALGSLIWAFS